MVCFGSGLYLTYVLNQSQELVLIVFGLAVSVGSLILIQNQVATWQDFAWNLLLFGFSFLVIVLIWILFSQTISALPSGLPYALFL